MKLWSRKGHDGSERLTLIVRSANTEKHVDFKEAVNQTEQGTRLLKGDSMDRPPLTLLELLNAGDIWWDFALQLEGLLCNEQALLDRLSLSEPLRGAALLQPRSLRDFYAFESHVKNARSRRGLPMLEEWYNFPVFYFSNANAVIGDGEDVRRPGYTQKLDYELEAAVIVRKQVVNAEPADLFQVTAGLTLMNDWSARDVQAEEMKVGLGPAKGKDFATSLGRVFVSWDELSDVVHDHSDGHGPRIDLSVEASVNGVLRSSGNLRDMYFTFGDLLKRASAEVTLYPGEVIGSGTVGTGCILEIGNEVQDWLSQGDIVQLKADRIGTLTNPIVK